jgi:hypothetical protein
MVTHGSVGPTGQGRGADRCSDQQFVAGWISCGENGTSSSWAGVDRELEKWLGEVLEASGALVPDARTRAGARRGAPEVGGVRELRRVGHGTVDAAASPADR